MADFTVKIEKGKPYRILQLTDMQIIDAAQQRYPTRLKPSEAERWVTGNIDKNCLDLIRKEVTELRPDCIIITGDIVYGEFDDSGSSHKAFIDCLGSFGIPWIPIFGNHDNETKIGVEKQCEMYASAPNCLFARGDTDGNSNYTVALCEDGKPVRILYMMDSNCCGGGNDPALCKIIGFSQNQLEWAKKKAEENGRIPGFFCCHVPPRDYYNAIVEAGYQTAADAASPKPFEFSEEIPAKNGDNGRKAENVGGTGQILHGMFKEMGVDGYFGGHYHNSCLSVLYDGIRYTLGVKSGTYDYHMYTGATVIDIAADRKNFTVTPYFD